jgi:hypothetical protein
MTFVDGELLFDRQADIARRPQLEAERKALEAAEANRAPAQGGAPPRTAHADSTRVHRRRRHSGPAGGQPAMKSTKRLANLLAAFALCMLCSSAVGAQDPDRTDPSMTNTPAPAYVIRNARVVTVSGADIDNATVVIANGRIAAVGASARRPRARRRLTGVA